MTAATLIEFRPRSTTPPPHDIGPLLAWHQHREFVVGMDYREVPTDRMGRFLGVTEVPVLERYDITPVVLLFRCLDNDEMFTYSQFDAQTGIAYEEAAP